MSKFKNLLILVAVLLIFISCSEKRDEANIAANRTELKNIAQKIDNDFLNIENEVANLAVTIQKLYEPENIKKNMEIVDRSKYKVHSSGVLYRENAENAAAVWLTMEKSDNIDVIDIICFTEPMDVELVRIAQAYPEIVQAYYNDKNSYNRIFPYMDVVNQYAPSMDIPTYNFYFLADEDHNPEKKAVWVDEPYVDPAGRGWMVSAIAPVYVDGELVGVPGLDVTINTITERYIQSNISNLLILDRNSVVVSTNDFLTSLFSLPPLKDHKYLETIKMDTYKSDNYNLLKSKSPQIREIAKAIYEEGQIDIVFQKDDQKYMILVEKINALNWFIIKVIQ